MFELSKVAKAINAIHLGKDVRVAGVTCDSRSVRKGDMFVALKGQKFDAHDFVDDAFDSGAVAAMVSANWHGDIQKPLLVVSDSTRLGFGRLAAWWREKFEIPVIAVTGSNGKTTVKEMIASILQDCVGKEKVLSTLGNLNNDVGVPITLVRIRKKHKYAVIEMGMNSQGEIGYLSNITSPSIGLITNAGSAHVGRLGSVLEVAKAKGELVDDLKPGSTIILNLDDPNVDRWRRQAAGLSIVTFGFGNADVSATVNLESSCSDIHMSIFGKNCKIKLQVPGIHNVRNALAAAAVSSSLGISLENITSGLEKYSGLGGRLRLIKLPGKIRLYDDSYNANPESMKAALSVLAKLEGPKFFIMGDMGELGTDSAKFHEEIGKFAKENGVDRLYGIGKTVAFSVKSFGRGSQQYLGKEDLLEDLRGSLRPGVNILVKGSRSAKLETLVSEIIGFCDLNFSI